MILSFLKPSRLGMACWVFQNRKQLRYSYKRCREIQKEGSDGRYLSFCTGGLLVYDILVRNAKIADGTGNPMYHADVAIKNGKISRIGYNLQGDAQCIIDGSGKVLAPGFIDAHNHLDGCIEEVPYCSHMLAQGVTTIIGGMCGDSPVPISAKHFEDGLRLVGKHHSEGSLQARMNLSNYIQLLEKHPLGTNAPFLIGHSNIRVAAMGCCPGPCFHGFLIRKTRLSEMHMHITETGKNNMSTGKGNSFTAAGIKKQCGGFLGPGHLAHCPAHCFHLRICIIKALFSGKAGIRFQPIPYQPSEIIPCSSLTVKAESMFFLFSSCILHKKKRLPIHFRTGRLSTYFYFLMVRHFLPVSSSLRASGW